MNSLAGIIYPDVYQNTHDVRKMLSFAEHRVPLSSREIKDIYKNKAIELGVCGKKIGHTKSGHLHCGIDGYLLNHIELAEILKKKGYPLESLHPEQVILHAYEEWGPGFLERLEGDFALFIYDEKEGQLLLARDRIGKKPLYWADDQGGFLFCSSLKGILGTGLIPQTPDNYAIATYFYLGYFPQDLTPIQKINKLLPGHYLLLDKSGSKIISPYWSYSALFEKPQQIHRNAIAQKLNAMLDTAVQKNIPTNVMQIGTLLTGGLGSSSVAYYLKKNGTGHEIEGFTSSFKKESEKDFEVAHQVAEILGIPQNSHVLTPENFLNDFVSIVWHLDEPVADPNVISYWNMAQAAADYSTELFSGMGCDELFAGHSRYSTEEQQGGVLLGLQNTLRELATKYLVPVVNKIYSPWAYTILKHSRKNIWQSEYVESNALISKSEMENIAPNLCNLFDPEVFLSKFYNITHMKSPTASYLYFDVKTSLPDRYMLEVERVTSAFALQWHTPFLTKNIVEFAASLPMENELTEKETASALKTLLKPVFPESLINRPKRSRYNFLANWIETSELHLLFEELTKGTLVEVGIVDENWIAEAVKTPESRKENFRILWAILSLEVWFKLYINNPLTVDPPYTTVRDLLQES